MLVDFPSPALRDEIFHYVVIPAALWFATRARMSVKQHMEDVVSKSAELVVARIFNEKLSQEIRPIMSDLFAQRIPELKQFIREDNDALLQRINGTYVRAKEFEYKHEGIESRLARLEDRQP